MPYYACDAITEAQRCCEVPFETYLQKVVDNPTTYIAGCMVEW
jgi:hypothetical protein